MNRSQDHKTHAAFAGTVFIGGANFIAVSLSNQELPPLYGASLRFALAAMLFLVIGRIWRVPPARSRSTVGAAIYGILGFGVSYALLYYSLVGLSAGSVAVILASVPLVTLLIAVVLGQERLSARGLVGGLLAIAGIGVLSVTTLGGDLSRSYLIAAILATVAVSASSVVAKAFPEVHPVNMNGIGMAAGTILLAAGSLVLAEPWALPRERMTWMALGWLVLMGSVGLFQLFLYVIKRLSASATVYAVAAMPVVAVGLGVVMLDQPATMEVIAGGALVIAAVYIGAISRMRGGAKTSGEKVKSPNVEAAS
jgi:drug/metabolite transporter (DMT)-like permease